MAFDLVSLFVLSLFGAFAAGGGLGWLIGRWASFETALGVGLLLPGLVMSGFFVTFVLEHHTFTRDPARVEGRVLRIEDRELGEGTSPVAVVEFETADGARHEVDSGAGTSLRPGDAVVILPNERAPDQSRVGAPDELQGGAIAALLFSTFPLSASVFFLLGPYLARRHRPTPLSPKKAAVAAWLMRAAHLAFVLSFLAAGLWEGNTEDRLRLLFAVSSMGLWLYVAEGLWTKRNPQWILNVGVIAVNFTVWVVVLGILIDAG